MLAGQHAADLDAKPQDIGAECLGTLDLAGLVGVVEDQRVQIAVAGMKHIGDRQPVLLRQLPHSRQHLGQPGARDRAVHAVIIGRDPADRRKRRLAPGPESEPLGLVWLSRIDRGTVVAGDLLDLADQMIDLGLRPVQLDDQQRLDIERIAGIDKIFGGVDRRPVHHLHAARNDAGGDDRGDAIAGSSVAESRSATPARSAAWAECARSPR